MATFWIFWANAFHLNCNTIDSGDQVIMHKWERVKILDSETKLLNLEMKVWIEDRSTSFNKKIKFLKLDINIWSEVRSPSERVWSLLISDKFSKDLQIWLWWKQRAIEISKIPYFDFEKLKRYPLQTFDIHCSKISRSRDLPYQFSSFLLSFIQKCGSACQQPTSLMSNLLPIRGN